MAANKALRRLVARIHELTATIQCQDEQIEELQDDLYAVQEQAHYREEAACLEKRRLQDDLNRTRTEAQYRDWEREDAVRSLENARSWGDSYGVEKAVRKLKYL